MVIVSITATVMSSITAVVAGADGAVAIIAAAVVGAAVAGLYIVGVL